jgi:hypothetical protein
MRLSPYNKDAALLHKPILQCGHMGNIFECVMLMNGEPHVILALLVRVKEEFDGS